MKVYPIELATAEVRARFLSAEGDPRERVVIPVGAFLILHPRAKVLVDAGLPVPLRVRDRTIGRFLVGRWRGRLRSLPAELSEHGLEPAAITHLVLTHLHWDHTGCSDCFPRAEVLVASEDLAALSRQGAWRRGHAGVILPRQGQIRALDFDSGFEWPPFERALDLLGDRSILLVRTPGHTPGSLTVLVQADPDPLLLCGDACYRASALLQGAGNGAVLGRPLDRDHALASVTRARLREALVRYPRARLLPSHDPDVWEDLPRWPQAIGAVRAECSSVGRPFSAAGVAAGARPDQRPRGSAGP